MAKQCMGCMELYDGEVNICPHCGYIEGTKAEEAVHMEPGTILENRYTIGKVLGYGGFGVTYIAWDKLLEQKVAIKEYLPSEFSTRMPGEAAVTIFGGDRSEQFSEGLEKFVEEAKRLSKFQNEQGIVKIFDSFRANDTAYIVMEYLDGETLEAYLEREGTVSEDQAVEILLPILNSLQVVHKEDILHRDIAPENIFITKDGNVKLIDFGASRYATTSHSRSLTVIIKPGYSPEEQYRSRGDQGPHTDLYALAAVMYKMVTGITPPDALERRAMIERKKKDLLKNIHKVNKDISPNVENAILNAMNVQIEDRTPDLAAFVSELNSEIPVKRRYGKIKKIDVYAWPLWLKVVAPSCFIAFLITGLLLITGAIKFESLFSGKVVVPDGIVIVPDVEGTSTEEALKKLEKMNLTPSPEGNVESEYVEAGIIVLQSPYGGSYLEKHGKVSLTVSSGKGVIAAEDGISTVPYVVWDTQEAAIEKLKAAGLAEPIIETAYDDYVAEGKVISQSETSGTKLAEGTQITITVSLGVKPFAMPNVVGQTKDEAEKNLLSKGLVVGFEYVTDNSVSENTVVGQDISKGTSVKKGTKVTLRISSKEKTINVADVVGKTKADASTTLKNQGFIVTVLENYDSNVAKGNVISQTPSAGTSQIKGTNITITVSKGVPVVTVPNVVGKTESTAKITLIDSKLEVKVVYKEDETVEEGKVISQTPAAKTTQEQGTLITIYVSTGKPLVTVPNVVGKAKEDAISALNNAGFTVSTSEEFSSTVETGKVISQTVKEGQKVSKGTKIELVVSLGAPLERPLETPESYFSISVSNGKAEITDFDENYEGAVVIPQTIQGYTVTSIGRAAFNECVSLTSITIPSSVTSIGERAFRACTSLTSITIPSSVTSIGERAFAGCSSLTSITIPSSVTSIGRGAFIECVSLTSITIPSSVTSIGEYAFGACVSLTSITIPSSVTSIGESMFEVCVSLTSITIPSSVTSIGERAFAGCSSLTSITIPSGVTTIEYEVFDSCSSLTSITIPSSVTSIETAAFSGCSSLTSITIPSGVTTIGNHAFSGCSSLTSITIPTSVTSIQIYTFAECSSLTSVIIPDSVTIITDNAFSGCTSLKTVYFSSQAQKDKYAHLFSSSVELVVQ